MAVRACVIGRQKMGNLCVFGRNFLRHGKRENLDVREDEESLVGQHANRAGSGGSGADVRVSQRNVT